MLFSATHEPSAPRPSTTARAAARDRAEQRREQLGRELGQRHDVRARDHEHVALEHRPVSRNATTSGSSSTTCAGSLPATTAQNRQPSPGTRTTYGAATWFGGAAVEERDRDVRGRRGDERTDAAGDEAERADDDERITGTA